MELMDESLTRFLDRSHDPLPYHVEVNLCHDITLALSYLHSNGIVHRDLSSNNVLLIAGCRAKVTDFGMVKLCNVNHSKAHFTPLTLCPGTSAYMSPEALGEPPVYTEKLDSFSVGVLYVQIMTRQFPDPGDRFQVMKISDPRIPSGRVKVDIPEIERRQPHIDLIDQAHPLLPVALDCLHDRDQERPSCHELCSCMSTLKAHPKYAVSVQLSQVNTKLIQSANLNSVVNIQQNVHFKCVKLFSYKLTTHRESREREIQQSQQIRDLQEQLHTLSDQLQEKEQENQQQRQQILGLQTFLTTKDEQLADKHHQPQQKEAAHQQEIQELRQQLHSSEQVTTEFQRNYLEREKTIRDQQRRIQEVQDQARQRGGQRQQEVEVSGIAASRGVLAKNQSTLLVMHEDETDGSKSTSYDTRRALKEASKQKCGDRRLHCTLFYKCQGLQDLGDESHRVHVLIYIHESVHNDWNCHLDNAIYVINEAAPGLNLYKSDNLGSARVRIHGNSEDCIAETLGKIQSKLGADIYLYDKWPNKKGTSVQTLLHALGFEHEQKHLDGCSVVDVRVEDDQYKPECDILPLMQFDPHSIITSTRNEMSEVDKVGLNLIYKPCKGPHYNPRLSAATGMWYCGRKVMGRYRSYCGPNSSANCHACRVLRNDIVQKQKDKGKWQGLTGLFYCRKYFGQISSIHDGYCGPNNGPPCPECKKILTP